jgi:hypothetical protein
MATTDRERWETLIERGLLDELFDEVTIEQAGEAWHRYHRRELETGQTDGDEHDWWAIELAWAISHHGGEDRRRAFIAALVDAAVTEDDFGNVGAGPIEDFISDDESRLAWIEHQAATSVRFRRAMANVYVWGIESDEVAARVERASTTRLPRPRGWTGP